MSRPAVARRAARAGARRAGARAATPRTSLPDIEDEVMCVECGTPLERLRVARGRPERALIRRQIAAGKTKAQIKADLVDAVRPGRARRAGSQRLRRRRLARPGRCSCCSPRPASCFAAAALAARAAPAPEAPVPPRARPRRTRARLDADLARYDR